MTEQEMNIQKTGEMAAGILGAENGETSRKVSLFDKIKNFNIVDLAEDGGVGAPLLLWFLGVPGGLVIILWLFFFRGR